RWITAALQLTDVMVEQFWDPAEGGFFYTGRDHEQLISRAKEADDNAIPSGNAMAVTALLRLAKLTGRQDLWQKAEQTLRLFQAVMAGNPMAGGQLLIALDFYLGPVQEVAVVGDPAAADTKRVLGAVRKKFAPNRVVAFKSAAGDTAELERAVPLLAGKS